MFNDNFVTHLLMSVVREFLKMVSICRSYAQEYIGTLLMHSLQWPSFSCRPVFPCQQKLGVDDDTDAKMILMAPHQITERDHQGVLMSRGSTPSTAV